MMYENPQQMVERLRTAFERSELPDSPWPADSSLTSHEITAWQRVQDRVSTNAPAYANVSCLLALHGIDYSPNLGRLLTPYVLWKCSPAEYRTEYGFGEDEALRAIPAHLARLYHRRRDRRTLECLLELDLAGAGAQAACREATAILWDEHQIEILRAASISKLHARRIAVALAHTCRLVSVPSLWPVYELHLRLICHQRHGPSVTRAARSVLYCLRQLHHSLHYRESSFS